MSHLKNLLTKAVTYKVSPREALFRRLGGSCSHGKMG